jgi:disulfide oxidoreductase YuzD
MNRFIQPMKKKPHKIIWTREPEDHDYPAAASYLGLIYAPKDTKKLVKKLRHAPMVSYYAKDVFRAARLPLLGAANSHVKKVREKILRKLAISPILLIRDEAIGQVVIADGYHRMCAVYTFDEDAILPCKIV